MTTTKTKDMTIPEIGFTIFKGFLFITIMLVACNGLDVIAKKVRNETIEHKEIRLIKEIKNIL